MENGVSIPVSELADALDLDILNAGSGEITFTTNEINRPGLQLTGFYEHFGERRVQLIGNAEMYYLYSLSTEELFMRLERFMSYAIPCIVCSRGNQPPDALIYCAERHSVPVFLSDSRTDDIGGKMASFLGRRLAPKAHIHGELLDIFGVGVLIRGPNGIGKSETALGLIKDGHRLVADDVVEVTRVNPSRVVGCAPELTKHLMEVRGLGIIDVRYLYGVGAVIDEKSIDLIIDLELWSDDAPYEQTGSTECFSELLGVDIPAMLIPVSTGRNLKVVVEVAARNFRLKRQGYDAADEFERKTMKHIDDDEH